MPSALPVETIAAVTDRHSLLSMLAETLNWQSLDDVEQLEDFAYQWTDDDLQHPQSQIERLATASRSNQPWGIFIVEFSQSKLSRTALRQVLRGLVPSRRNNPSLPAWDHENLLFICTTRNHGSFTFAHFRGDKAQTSRLTTFGWQQGDRNLRTLREFNLPALVWPDDGGKNGERWLKDWAKAFDKEPLTKDFFKRFDKVVDAVKFDLETHQKLESADAYSRAQLLIERLVFLYFLQKRGWLDQKADFLLHHFEAHREHPKEFSYSIEILEKLFWTLASAPGPANRFSGIPFLNGGLFDDDEFNPARKKHNPPLKVTNATFAMVFSELLEAFNFTVREDTPIDQDVAVDPEMLGKVFESIVLHAEAADPDAVAPDKRKATGSYYTPRIVVHFICREALIQYLTRHFPTFSPGEPGASATGERTTASETGEPGALATRRKEGQRAALNDSPVADAPGSPVSDATNSSRIRQLFELDASHGLSPSDLAKLKTLLSPKEAVALRDKLKDLKCCDPAVGSGAFPVGLLHELVVLRRIVETAANGYVDPIRKDGGNWLCTRSRSRSSKTASLASISSSRRLKSAAFVYG